MNARWRMIVALAALILGACSGCISSKQESRKQAIAHWQQVRTGVTLQMAQQQLQKGQAQQARQSLLEALRGNPNDPQLHLLLGRVCFELRDPTTARAELARAQALAPELAEADYWQGIVAQAVGQPEQALAAYQAAAGKAPDSAEYLCAMLEARLAAGQSQEVLDAATGRFRDFPTDARLRMLAAQAAVQQGDLAQAEGLYEQAVAIDPLSEEAKQALARVLCQEGRYERAMPLLLGLVESETAGRDARPLLAGCHLACGRYEKAERLYEECLAADPDRAALRLRLNEARLLSGQARRVRQDLQSQLQRRCDDPAAWELLGHACVLDEDLPQARLAYERAIQCGAGEDRLRAYLRAIETVNPQAVTRTDP